MATRFLLPASSATTPVSPTFDAGWAVTTFANRRRMSPTSQATASQIHNIGNANGTDPNDVLAAQFVSDPLAQQEIAGTVKGQIRCNEGIATLNARSQISVRAVLADGTTVRGTLMALSASALTSEWGTSLTNRAVPLLADSPAVLTPVAIDHGDRLVVEIGLRAHSTIASDGSIAFRDNGTDLAENEVDTASGNTWLEFSQDLVFGDVAPPGGVIGWFSPLLRLDGWF